MAYTKAQYKRAFEIACDLLNDNILRGIDVDLIKLIRQEYGVVSSDEYQKFILANLDRFSDDDEVRDNAIKRLGW